MSNTTMGLGAQHSPTASTSRLGFSESVEDVNGGDGDLQGNIPTAFGSSRNRSGHGFSKNGLGKGKRSKESNRAIGDDDHAPDWAKHTTGLGAKLLLKMGHVPGTGLGESGQGIARPIETKLRPKAMGIAFGGFKEKTAQAREDEIKRGEDEKRARISKKTAKENDIPGWMKKSLGRGQRSAQPRKKKITYRTVDEVIALAEQETAQQSQTMVVDYTGPQVRTITSTDIRSTPTGRAASTRFMELRHNLDLLTDMARKDVARCGREKRLLTAQHTEAETEANLLDSKITHEQQGSKERNIAAISNTNMCMVDIKRLEQVMGLVKTCQTLAKDNALTAELSMTVYEEYLIKLHTEYVKEYGQLSLDNLVIALLVPVVRHQLSADWEPLKDPACLVEEIRKWRPFVNTPAPHTNNGDNDVYQHHWPTPTIDKKQERVMTAYESMFYHYWLPRIRSTLNNEWDPHNSDPAVMLFEQWKDLLPQFIFDNICHQVILPKLRRAIDDWNPRQDPVKIHTWLHPWLPVMSEWMEELWTPIRHKYTVILQQWHPSDPSALDVLLPWQGVFQSVDMDHLLTTTILPKLTMALRVEFEVNPQQQDLAPLEWVLSWLPMLPTTTMAQLLEQEFFPKWLELLSLWLQGKPNYDEVTEWYMYWKNLFPEEIREHPRIQDGFRRGLDLMNQMIA
ncbi:GC-rich sequence DNA-binding factor-like protein-domain-containing protein [Syncephalis fuscata]|nr:GC-rich sequence DNA-binding factor-like protein-domain-containing protein [Syncephalis fuscata]